MASGNDARIGMSTETVYGTRVAPARFFPFMSEGIDYAYNPVELPVLGTGMWSHVTRTSTQGGSGTFTTPVTTTGFGYLLKFLHNNTVTPVQVGATDAYTQTHTLSTPPTKSASIQVQTPPVSSATLLAQDFTGAMFGSLELSWGVDSGLMAAFTVTPKKMTAGVETLATYVAPTAWSFFTFMDIDITIGGVSVANTGVGGDGSLTLSIPMRDDFYELGSDGTIAKPQLNAKPTVTAEFTGDFNNFDHWNRTVNDTHADLVFTATHPVEIDTGENAFISVTVPDCRFQSPRPQVTGPDLLQQTITATADSSTGDPPVIVYQSIDIAL